LTDESLRWVLANGKVDKAKAIIKTACSLNNKNYEQLIAKVGLGHLENTSTIADVTEVEEMLNGNDIGVVDELKEANGTIEKTDMTIQTKNYTFVDIAKNLPVLKVSLIIWYIW
jgi:hypothetical protein